MSIATEQQPTSTKKADANRRNSLKSTGPRTEAGKRWSRRNALKHALFATTATISDGTGKGQREFRKLVDRYEQWFMPVGPCEEFLVTRLANDHWNLINLNVLRNQLSITEWHTGDHDPLRRRIRDSEDGPDREIAIDQLVSRDVMLQNFGSFRPSLPSGPRADLVPRYENGMTRSYMRAMNELRRAQTVDRYRLHPELEELPPEELQPQPEPEPPAQSLSEAIHEALETMEDPIALLEQKLKVDLVKLIHTTLGIQSAEKESAEPERDSTPRSPREVDEAIRRALLHDSRPQAKNDETKPNSPASEGEFSEEEDKNDPDSSP